MESTKLPLVVVDAARGLRAENRDLIHVSLRVVGLLKKSGDDLGIRKWGDLIRQHNLFRRNVRTAAAVKEKYGRMN